MTAEEIDNILSHHPPIGGQTIRYGTLRELAKSLGHAINDACPESREKSLAMTCLQETLMWAIASIAVNEVDTESVK